MISVSDEVQCLECLLPRNRNFLLGKKKYHTFIMSNEISFGLITSFAAYKTHNLFLDMNFQLKIDIYHTNTCYHLPQEIIDCVNILYR